MRRPVFYSILGIALVATAVGVALFLRSRRSDLGSKILAAYREDADYEGLTIRYPLDETLFPPEIVAPTFRWEDSQPDADAWLVTVKFAPDGSGEWVARYKGMATDGAAALAVDNRGNLWTIGNDSSGKDYITIKYVQSEASSEPGETDKP